MVIIITYRGNEPENNKISLLRYCRVGREAEFSTENSFRSIPTHHRARVTGFKTLKKKKKKKCKENIGNKIL